MDNLTTFGDLIALWPDRRLFSVETGISLDVTHKLAKGSRTVRTAHLPDILDAAHARGIPLTAEQLVRLAASVAPPEEDAA